MKIAYLVSQYPMVSHSFIRREILALEGQGFDILRIALRGWNEPLPDAGDQRERSRTRYVLKNPGALLLATLGTCVHSPQRFFAALVLALRMSRSSNRPLPYHLAYFAEACRVVGWLRKFGACHVHAHFGNNPAEVVMLAGVLGGPPYSFTVHGPGEFIEPMGLDEKIHRANFVVAISDFGRSQLYLRAHHEDWAKVKVVRCGLERAFYASQSRPIGSAPRLVCVGRLCAEKGQLLLIEAAVRIRSRGIPFDIVLAGDGQMRRELESLIRSKHLDDRVRITGWISSDRVREEILASRALVLPSFAEGLPVVIMEAMALGRPVLTTYVAGIPELVRDGETGWLFPAGSVDALEEAMLHCLSAQPEELRAMGDAGIQRVLSRHCIDHEAAKLARLVRAPRTAGSESDYGGMHAEEHS